MSLRPIRVPAICRAGVFAVLAAVCLPGARAAQVNLNTHAAPPPRRWRDATLDEYRQHLTALVPVVDACANTRDLKTCDPLLVGPDDNIPFGAGRRLIRYGWLRVLLSRAEEPDQKPAAKNATPAKDDAEPAGTRPAPLTTSALLQAAKTRLSDDLAQAGVAAAPAASHTAERAAMRQILAGKDFRGLDQQSVRDSLLEKVGNWLNNFFARAAGLRARAAWIGRVLVWGFVAGVCIALAWALLQMERRWRVRLVPDDRAPAPGAASARAWQAWLDDARRAAAAGQWREAIHFVYWASISRLESRRLWPADRARTPREYLALVAADDPRKAGLAALTGSFECTWYGGRPAAQSDYQRAEELASALIDGGAR